MNLIIFTIHLERYFDHLSYFNRSFHVDKKNESNKSIFTKIKSFIPQISPHRRTFISSNLSKKKHKFIFNPYGNTAEVQVNKNNWNFLNEFCQIITATTKNAHFFILKSRKTNKEMFSKNSQTIKQKQNRIKALSYIKYSRFTA